jgi:hypothetical protein
MMEFRLKGLDGLVQVVSEHRRGAATPHVAIVRGGVE